jgi:hypothetical protein
LVVWVGGCHTINPLSLAPTEREIERERERERTYR